MGEQIVVIAKNVTDAAKSEGLRIVEFEDFSNAELEEGVSIRVCDESPILATKKIMNIKRIVKAKTGLHLYIFATTAGLRKVLSDITDGMILKLDKSATYLDMLEVKKAVEMAQEGKKELALEVDSELSKRIDFRDMVGSQPVLIG